MSRLPFHCSKILPGTFKCTCGIWPAGAFLKLLHVAIDRPILAWTVWTGSRMATPSIGSNLNNLDINPSVCFCWVTKSIFWELIYHFFLLFFASIPQIESKEKQKWMPQFLSFHLRLDFSSSLDKNVASRSAERYEMSKPCAFPLYKSTHTH